MERVTHGSIINPDLGYPNFGFSIASQIFWLLSEQFNVTISK